MKYVGGKDEKSAQPFGWLRAAGIALALMALAGCYGTVGGYGYYGPGYYGPGYFNDYGPDVWVFGGYDHGHRDWDYGHRGFESRGGGHGGHFGGGGHH